MIIVHNLSPLKLQSWGTPYTMLQSSSMFRPSKVVLPSMSLNGSPKRYRLRLSSSVLWAKRVTAVEDLIENSAKMMLSTTRWLGNST